MPSNITNLDELVGQDHEFVYRGTTYKVPGDPATESVFEFLMLYDDLLSAQVAASGAEGAAVAGEREKVQKLYGTIEAKLLVLFRELDPDLEELPFGFKGTMHVLRVVLGLLGVTVDGDAGPPAPAPTPKRATSVKKAPAKRRATTRSTRRA